MRAYVTGGRGFVGGWLVAHLEEAGDDVVLGDADVTDVTGLAAEVAAAGPDAVYHLAAVAHVGRSWEVPGETFAVNATGTLNLLDGLRALGTAPRVLVVSSAEVYGAVAPDELPLTESSPLRPHSPYAASKVAAEFLGVQAALGYGLPVVVARAFNHVGPGQSPSFVVPGLAARIKAAARDGATSIAVGNLTPQRDITDVRDVVRAYRLLVERGTPGEAYNVCTGRSVSVQELADRMLTLAGARLELRADPALVRPVDVPVLLGDASKLRAATGWTPERGLDETLADVLAASG